VEAALELGEYDAVIACNDAGAHWPGRLNHWASLHPDRLAGWEGWRRQRGLPGGWTTWGHRAHANVMKWTPDWGGSSGLLATKVAIEIGATRIVLCGVPISGDLGHFVRNAPWQAAKGFQRGWLRNKAALGNVRSMSGWTRELLGAPDEGWLTAAL
jgi:hypothetical protein